MESQARNLIVVEVCDRETHFPHFYLWEFQSYSRPRQQGGLGVKNLELQNKAMLMKQLHKFYAHADTPWVKLGWSLYGDSVPHTKTGKGSFWWRDIFSLVGVSRVGGGLDRRL
jgi:hypothetical protein